MYQYAKKLRDFLGQIQNNSFFKSFNQRDFNEYKGTGMQFVQLLQDIDRHSFKGVFSSPSYFVQTIIFGMFYLT